MIFDPSLCKEPQLPRQSPSDFVFDPHLDTASNLPLSHHLARNKRLQRLQSPPGQNNPLSNSQNEKITENPTELNKHAIDPSQSTSNTPSSSDIATQSNPVSPHKHQKLTVIGYASDAAPAHHLVSFAQRYQLDLHLIGVNKPWGGFNDKISGFYQFIESLDNEHNESIVMILDAYDTVPICHARELLDKFNAFEADIVMSTGKDCWPDPNVSDFLLQRLSDEDKEKYKFFPWFLCPNSGAIIGRHDAMLAMFGRVQKLVELGNGSCADFAGNKFSKNTQSDQRCYTTYFVELAKYHESRNANRTDDNADIVDVSKPIRDKTVSADGTVSKRFFVEHGDEEAIARYYKDITFKLDYTNELFLSMGGMMFMDIDTDIANETSITMRSKITNGSACILHGNGPGVILWRSYVKQIEHGGNLYIDDYVLRVGVDFFHWLLWWIIMPCERLSHWLSVTYHFDLGFHSTTFSETVIWRFHVWTFLAVVILLGVPLLYWYKYIFRANMKVSGRRHRRRHHDHHQHHHDRNKKKYQLKLNREREKPQTPNLLDPNHPITQQLVKGLVNLEIMVHTHNGASFPALSLKTQKKN